MKKVKKTAILSPKHFSPQTRSYWKMLRWPIEVLMKQKILRISLLISRSQPKMLSRKLRNQRIPVHLYQISKWTLGMTKSRSILSRIWIKMNYLTLKSWQIFARVRIQRLNVLMICRNNSVATSLPQTWWSLKTWVPKLLVTVAILKTLNVTAASWWYQSSNQRKRRRRKRRRLGLAMLNLLRTLN